MGYKRDDSCLAKVGEDEPIFVLRAQDVLAPTLVRGWVALARARGAPAHKCEEALACALRMEAWQAKHHAKTPD